MARQGLHIRDIESDAHPLRMGRRIENSLVAVAVALQCNADKGCYAKQKGPHGKLRTNTSVALQVYKPPPRVNLFTLCWRFN